MSLPRESRTAPVRYTLSDFPVGSFIMTPQTGGRPHKPLEVVAHRQGEVRVQPKGEAEVTVSLLAKGVEPVTQDILNSLDFSPPLKHSEFKELIQQGDIDALRGALARAGSNVERVACIVRKYPRQGNGTTLLHIAAGHVNASVAEDTSIEVLRHLLDTLSCWDLTEVLDSRQQTPLWDALMDANHSNLIELIKHQPASLKSKLVQFTDDHGQNALMATVQQCAEEVRTGGDASTIEGLVLIASYLIAKGTNVKAADNAGWTVVHHCVPKESSTLMVLKPAEDLAALCQLFIQKGCPVDAKDFEGITALFWACAVGDDHLSPLVHTLARSGADPDLVVPRQEADRNTPRAHAEFLHGKGCSMLQTLSILQLSPAERRALPAVDTMRSKPRPHQAAAAAVMAAPPARARAPRQRKRSSGRGVGSGAGGSAPRGGARLAPGAAPAPAQAAPPVQVSAAMQAAVGNLGGYDDLDVLSSVLEKPTVELTSTDFTQHDCYLHRKLQLIENPAIQQAREDKVAGWCRSQLDHMDNRRPEVVIVACYGCPSGPNQRPPYGTSTAFYYLAKNAEQFFQEPFYGSPGTRLEAVSMDDPREALRGEATVYADRDIGLWEIIGAYTGRVMTEEELATESKSLLMLNKLNDYVFAMNTRVTVDGEEEQLLVSPYPTLGNEMMAINDGKLDGKPVNCGWMEVLYRGWPYVFVVNISRRVIRQGDELLLDYSTGSYWRTKEQMDEEQAGVLNALKSPAIGRILKALKAIKRARTQ